uniref:4Fe-4S Wbl-type domain-containing protein n=1 Tax=Mycobacterium sp. (strain KMS) TaxID=189918 RepID=A1UIX4_MYCSK
MAGGYYRRRPPPPPPWLALCAAILRRAPKLEGAKCAGRAELFEGDGPDGERTRTAIALCRQCPALTACASWADGLSPVRRPRGVLAASYRPPIRDRL